MTRKRIRFTRAHARVYADRGIWTGEEIPAPTDCAPVAGVQTCGGFCGGCPVGRICTGRSPRHPYGLCVPLKGGVCSVNPKANGDDCKSGESCFIFKVEEERQPVADASGFCLPTAECQVTAASLPGGGYCK